jgi:transposase-like protein
MQHPTRVRKRLTPAQRADILRAYRGSSLSQRDFAAQAGIGASTLALWLRKAGVGSGGATEFIRLPSLEAAAAPAPYRLHLRGGTRLDIGQDFRSEDLARLLQLLGVPCSG